MFKGQRFLLAFSFTGLLPAKKNPLKCGKGISANSMSIYTVRLVRARRLERKSSMAEGNGSDEGERKGEGGDNMNGNHCGA